MNGKTIFTKNSEALVSIIVACHNEEKHIQQCVLSLLNQTYGNIEIIICDDNSNDKSYEILCELQKKIKE